MLARIWGINLYERACAGLMCMLCCRQFDYGPGGIVGELDFFLQQARSFEAVCKDSCTLLCISRYSFSSLPNLPALCLFSSASPQPPVCRKTVSACTATLGMMQLRHVTKYLV